MTPEQFTELMSKLDKIIEILEHQTYVLDSPMECSHERAVDVGPGTMGTMPGGHMHCPDCGLDYDANILTCTDDEEL